MNIEFLLKKITFSSLFIALFSIGACTGGEMAGPETITTESGLLMTTTQEGSGVAAEEGDFVNVHYTGWLYDLDSEGGRGTKFDSSVDRNRPFGFPLGAGRVIAGWDQGVTGMLIDEKRELIIPPELGYGSRGAGDVIPPDSTLLFEVQLLAIE
mgnify:FL=1